MSTERDAALVREWLDPLSRPRHEGSPWDALDRLTARIEELEAELAGWKELAAEQEGTIVRKVSLESHRSWYEELESWKRELSYATHDAWGNPVSWAKEEAP